MSDLDVLALDRTLSRAHQAWLRHRRALAEGEGLDDDPFAFTRAALGLTQLSSVRDLPAGDPLRAPLERWVCRLTEQRINREAIALAVHHRRCLRHPLDAPARGQWTLAEMLRESLRPTPHRRAWIDAATANAGTLVAVAALLWERRQELARRLGLAAPDALELAASPANAVLEQFVRATDDMVVALGARDLPAYLEAALATDAEASWPARLTPRALGDLLAGTPWVDRVELDLAPLPTALAPASFARGLVAVGAAYAHALAPAGQPFVVAREPHALPEHTHGALVGLLLLQDPFLRRRLDVGRASLAATRRALAAMVLAHARALALGLRLRAVAWRGRREFMGTIEEASTQVLGFTLPPVSAGILFRPRMDGASRFAGLLLAARHTASQIERHDEDWFLNPRAAEELREDAAVPVTSLAPESLVSGIAALRGLLARAL